MKKVPLKNKILFGIGDMYAGGSFSASWFIIFTIHVRYCWFISSFSWNSISFWKNMGRGIRPTYGGVLSDHTKSKFGRRRIYFLLGILPVFVTFSMLWIKISPSNQFALFLYYSISYILFNTSFTMVQVPYNAILADMTNSYKERAIMSGIRLTFSAISAIIAGTIPMILIKSNGYTFM